MSNVDLVTKTFVVKGRVEVFALLGAWYYVRVPVSQTRLFSKLFGLGLVPITVSLGLSNWDTSLLPMGDKTYFIALKAAIRKKEGVKVGDFVRLEYRLRGR